MQLISNKPLFTRPEFIEICLQVNPQAYVSMLDEEKDRAFQDLYEKAKKFQAAFDELKCPSRYFSLLLQQFLITQVQKMLVEYNKLLQAAYAQVMAQLEPAELEANDLEEFMDKRIIK